MHPNSIKFWLLRGEIEKLENVLLEGKGSRLLGETSPDLRTRVFLKSLPNYLTKISQLHEAVMRGSLADVQRIIGEEPKKKLALAKDASGTPILHKAVCYDQPEIVQWLVENYPATTQQKDKEGRTALHFCSACKEPDTVWDILVEGNCDITICDKKGLPASYYLDHSSELEFPDAPPKNMNVKKSRRKDSMEIKPSNIRIWIHNRDIGKLQTVLWEGHGMKLRRETSNNPRVKKFLEAVPFIMGTVKDIHTAVVNDDLDSFHKLTADPVSPIVLCSKDSNGLSSLHKAAGLGHGEMAREIINLYPNAVHLQDNDGRFPLHYSVVLKDDDAMYNLLVECGSDETKMDNKMKPASYYKSRQSEIDTSLLRVIPEATKMSRTKYPKNWDWRILESDSGVIRSIKRTPIRNKDPESEKKTKKSSPVKRKSGADLANETEEILNVEEPANGLTNGNEKEHTEVESNDKVENEENVLNGNENGNESTNENGIENGDENANEVHQNGEITNEQTNEIENPKVENFVKTEINPESVLGENTLDSEIINSTIEENQVFTGRHNELPEAEVNDANLGDDAEIEELVTHGNMEQLATLVLNGHGRRLLGRHSENPELQAFIDNVPAYMGKIHAVHVAAREGNLRDLQSALDRRKFAVARDPISPHGATPLHIAVIFGNTAIIRYLAGRFPETTHTIDVDGRTPLHYAATLADNGHYYNLLLHLGANPLVQDNFGHKPEYYKQNGADLSHKKLLRDFGARENLADEMLTDKEGGQLEIPIFHEEEGHYLASSLGDPLIKGLTEVAQNRPKDPVTYLATYLYNFANKKKSSNGNEESNVFILTEPGNEFNDDEGYPDNNDYEEIESQFNNPNRDDHGQSIIHFAAVRSHSRDSLYHMLQEAQINIGLRDELYRTPRDIAEEANMRENVEEIDRFVVSLAARGETEKLVELLLEGYDHILDAQDTGTGIEEVAKQHDHEDTIRFLQSVPHFLERQQQLHNAIKSNDVQMVKKIFDQCGSGARLLAVGKNRKGRCSLHLAVLQENENIVQLIARTYPETMQIEDNLKRTALHYAMGVPSVESISSILIKAGAKRIQRDLKSRQPSYYFMNKMEIESLQKEEKL